jgi:hypothetical protein
MCSELYSRVTFVCEDWKSALARANDATFTFVDPPYADCVDDTSGTEFDHQGLFLALKNQRGSVMLCNHDSDQLRAEFADQVFDEPKFIQHLVWRPSSHNWANELVARFHHRESTFRATLLANHGAEWVANAEAATEQCIVHTASGRRAKNKPLHDAAR